MDAISPAAQRNREPLAQAIAHVLPESGLVLEVASGHGDHALYFAERFPALDWQPTDRDEQSLFAMQARMAEAELENIRPPLFLDAALRHWPVAQADAVMCVNMIHISPWASTVGLFEGAARVLPEGAPLLVYGPFLEVDVATAASNEDFNANLKSRDPRWGLRRREDVDALAAKTGFEPTDRSVMPANNLTLIYRKRA